MGSGRVRGSFQRSVMKDSTGERSAQQSSDTGSDVSLQRRVSSNLRFRGEWRDARDSKSRWSDVDRERGDGDGPEGGGDERRETIFRILSKASSIFQAWLCESGRGRGHRSAPLSAAAVWILNDGGEARRSKERSRRKAEERLGWRGWRWASSSLIAIEKNLEISFETISRSMALSDLLYFILRCRLLDVKIAEKEKAIYSQQVQLHFVYEYRIYNIINSDERRYFWKSILCVYRF